MKVTRINTLNKEADKQKEKKKANIKGIQPLTRATIMMRESSVPYLRITSMLKGFRPNLNLFIPPITLSCHSQTYLGGPSE